MTAFGLGGLLTGFGLEGAFSAFGLRAAVSALDFAGTPAVSGLAGAGRSGAAPSGAAAATSAARAPVAVLTGALMTGIGSVVGSPGDEVSGLAAGCASPAGGCGAPSPPIATGQRDGGCFLAVILRLGVGVGLNRGPHPFQESRRQRRPGHPCRRPGPVIPAPYPPRQRGRGHRGQRFGRWRFRDGRDGRWRLEGWASGRGASAAGASRRGASVTGVSAAGASRDGGTKADPVVAHTTPADVSEDACSSSRLAASAAARTRSRKDSGRTGRATRAGGRGRSPVPRTRRGKDADASNDAGCPPCCSAGHRPPPAHSQAKTRLVLSAPLPPWMPAETAAELAAFSHTPRPPGGASPYAYLRYSGAQVKSLFNLND